MQCKTVLRNSVYTAVWLPGCGYIYYRVVSGGFASCGRCTLLTLHTMILTISAKHKLSVSITIVEKVAEITMVKESASVTIVHQRANGQ